MSRQFSMDVGAPLAHHWLRFIRLAAIGLGILLLGPAQVHAGPPGQAEAILRAHLDAGEFAPARVLAQQAGSRDERDHLLGQVAAAQAQAGARFASLSTARDIVDDQARSRWLEQIGSQPIRDWLGRGGAPEADFDALIELITTTIDPTSWEEVGGPGAIHEFEGGVFVDSAGVLRKLSRITDNTHLIAARQLAARPAKNQDVRRRSGLRMVSLTRLEKEVQLRWAAADKPDQAMRVLAGLEKIEYVFVYPELGDIMLAGPAGDWTVNGEGRLVSVATGRPVLRLDDLVVLLRNAFGNQQGRFGCSITPIKENLARTKAFLAATAEQPLKPHAHEKWLSQLRQKMGRQEIDVYGVDARTRVARVMVEADYRMKLVGMGLEEGTLGVTSYLDSIRLAPGQMPPPMSVLRWWFTLNYQALHANTARSAFQLRGQGVKVLSENELLTEQGERVHTGKSDELNREFAHGFTTHFAKLAARHPIYAELRNVFDLALVAALMRAEDMPGQVGWHMTHFADPQKYRVELGAAPRQVDSVLNHRVIPGKKRKHIVAGVSGGVSVNTSPLVRPKAIQAGTQGLLEANYKSSTPVKLSRGAWWWD